MLEEAATSGLCIYSSSKPSCRVVVQSCFKNSIASYVCEFYVPVFMSALVVNRNNVDPDGIELILT